MKLEALDSQRNIQNVLTRGIGFSPGKGSPIRLTAKDRVLLHIAEHPVDAEAPTVPAALTQEGIAEHSGFARRHFSILVGPLLRDGLLRERVAHVLGIRQRRKVYELTWSGRLEATRLRQTLESEMVPVQNDGRLLEARVSTLIEESGGTPSLARIAVQLSRNGFVDRGLLAAGSPRVEMLADAPRVGRFVGRTAELAEILKEDRGARITVVQGIAGIGKTSLAAQVCHDLRGRTNLFWHRVRPWDTFESILSSLSRFLSALGRPGLRSSLSRGQVGRIAQVLGQDLAGLEALLVFDDVHNATPAAIGFFRLLVETISPGGGVRALILTRRSAAFYDRRDVILRGVVHEIELEGLRPEEVAALWSTSSPEAPLPSFARWAAGHPLFLELIRLQGPTSEPPRALRDIRRFVEESIDASLSSRQREVMTIASLYEVPVPAGALLIGRGRSDDLLRSLLDRLLLHRVGDEKFECHETIRAFFAEKLASAERSRLSKVVRAHLRDLASAARSQGKLLVEIAYLSNAIRLSTSASELADLWESQGDASAGIGDLPGALTAFRQALVYAKEADTRARLHRRIGLLLCDRFEDAAALSEVEEALRELGRRRSDERAWIDIIRGRIAAREGRWAEARRRFESALRICHSYRSVRGEAEALLGPASNLEIRLRDLPATLRSLRRALRLAEKLEDRGLAARAHLKMGILTAFGNASAEEAMRHFDAVDALMGPDGDPLVRLTSLRLRGWVRLELEADSVGAQACFLESLRLARKCYSEFDMAIAQNGLATLAFLQGDWKGAQQGSGQYVRMASEHVLPIPTVDAVWIFALSSLVLRDLESFNRAISWLEGKWLEDSMAGSAVVEALRGLAALFAGDRGTAERHLSSAVHRREDMSSVALLGWIFSAPLFYGLLLRLDGNATEADVYMNRVREILRRHRRRAMLAVLPRLEDGLMAILSEVNSRDELSQSRVRVG